MDNSGERKSNITNTNAGRIQTPKLFHDLHEDGSSITTWDMPKRRISHLEIEIPDLPEENTATFIDEEMKNSEYNPLTKKRQARSSLLVLLILILIGIGLAAIFFGSKIFNTRQTKGLLLSSLQTDFVDMDGNVKLLSKENKTYVPNSVQNYVSSIAETITNSDFDFIVYTIDYYPLNYCGFNTPYTCEGEKFHAPKSPITQQKKHGSRFISLLPFVQTTPEKEYVIFNDWLLEDKPVSNNQYVVNIAQLSDPFEKIKSHLDFIKESSSENKHPVIKKKNDPFVFYIFTGLSPNFHTNSIFFQDRNHKHPTALQAAMMHFGLNTNKAKIEIIGNKHKLEGTFTDAKNLGWTPHMIDHLISDNVIASNIKVG